MGIIQTINSGLDVMFSPLLSLPPLWAIFTIAILLSILVTLLYKWLTDQELMKTLKQDIKALQQEMKKLRDKPDKMMEVNKRAMEKNMKYMMHSLKPTLVTFLPMILIIGWLSSHYAVATISTGESFTLYAFMDDVTINNATIEVPEGVKLLSSTTSDIIRIDNGEDQANLPFLDASLTKPGGVLASEADIYYAKWDLSANEGTHIIDVDVAGQRYAKQFSTGKTNGKFTDRIDDGKIKALTIDRGKLTVLNIFGWKLGWLGTYIIFSLIASLGLRKILKIH